MLTSAPPSTRRYLPALDGVRALAVLAVMAYHDDVRFVPGGFLGVDVFFVLSGFLITTLLAEEWQTRGSISLKHFYLRRALRLLPALAVLLTVCALAKLLTRPWSETVAFGKEIVVVAG